MSLLEEKLLLAKTVLSSLKKEGGSMRWTPLLKNALRRDGTPHTFQSIMSFLMKKRYVERASRGVYRITAKGTSFLKSL